MAANNLLSRRRVVRTVGSLAGATVITSIDASARSRVDDEPTDADQYVAVVDRIVDDRHVVLLLEEDGEVVDQHVEPASEMDDVEEGDILCVVIKDDDLLAYQHLSERPGDSADPDSSVPP
ncbi:hypothetical protein [Halosolutus gelatinilyticus]|uniref:hypothetical protein n=1 Tax=Halosolutus gelatinilyticus TaxID=2931975 RepID=UPI001FF175B4|nr:hypothetical protein [Halosolutus gelatinilyticus]